MEGTKETCNSKPMPMGRRRCAICGTNSYLNPELRFFRFPRDEVMSLKWAVACKKPDLLKRNTNQLYTSYRVCSQHFTMMDFSTNKMHRLRACAYPNSALDCESPLSAIKLDHTYADGTIAYPGLTVQTEDLDAGITPMEVEIETTVEPSHQPSPSSRSNIERKSLTPKTAKIKALKSQVYFLKKRLLNTSSIKMKAILGTIKRLVPETVYLFIASQLRASAITCHARRWTIEDKNLALKVYLASPRAYSVLSKCFVFPSKKTLLNCVSGISVRTGFPDTVFVSLKSVAVKMKQNDRICVMSFDEVKLKPGLNYNSKQDIVVGYEDYGPYCERTSKIATHALVFMARGLCQKWKQVIGSFFSCGTAGADMLSVLVSEGVRKLRESGLNPVAIACDQGSNNQKLYSQLKISVEQPYFYVDEKRLFALFDPPHLLKSLRNNLKKYGAIFDENKTASWDHIISLWEFDKNLPHRLAPKLGPKHVFVDGLNSMNVGLAAQVFSHSVSAGLCCLSAVNHLPPSASHTADFCAKMNDLFESVNSRVMQHKTRPLLSACSKTSPHLEHWKESMLFIKSIRFPTGKKKIRFPCLTGWQITLSAFCELIPELLTDVSFVMMSRFNQDALENFFSQVRRKGGNNDHPTPLDFLYRLRALLAQNFMNLCEKTNCELDEDFVLLPIQIMSSAENSSPSISHAAVSSCEMKAVFPDEELEIGSEMDTSSWKGENRPISLISVFCKILERIIYSHVI